MASDRRLTDEKLLKLVEKERTKFSSDYVPLHEKDLGAVKNCSALIAEDRNSIKRNTPKTRAHIILTDVWTHLPEVFVLCSLATNPTRLGSLESKSYLGKLLRWWEEIDRPTGLVRIVEQLSEFLPSTVHSSKQNSVPGSQIGPL